MLVYAAVVRALAARNAGHAYMLRPTMLPDLPTFPWKLTLSSLAGPIVWDMIGRHPKPGRTLRKAVHTCASIEQ